MRSLNSGHTDIVKLLIEADCNVNIADKELKNALHYALHQGKDELAIFMVLYGANIY